MGTGCRCARAAAGVPSRSPPQESPMTTNHLAAGALAAGAIALLSVPGVGKAAPGDPDPTFGTAGRQVVPGGGLPADVLVQGDGKVLVVTNGLDAAVQGFVVSRLNTDGTLDRSYDGDGTAIANFDAADVPAAAALQPDGKLVV